MGIDKIPKTIHFFWYGNAHYSSTIKRCMASWKEKLPDYKIKQWDESNTPFDKLPFLRLLYRQRKWAFISDYMRLYALYSEVGIYLDTDIEIIKRFDELHKEEAFLGFQTIMEASKNPVGSAFIGARQGNNFILDCLRGTEKKQRLEFNAMGISVLTQILVNNGLATYKNQYINGVYLLEKEYFYPFYLGTLFTPKCIIDKTICIHWWQDSWTSKKHDFKYYVGSIDRKIQKLPFLIASKLKYYLARKSFYYTDRIFSGY